ncbi:DUF2147 domain-containing protein [Sulfitobacter sp. D35]|uniref:DUF2147 domain-containing protein n=1 Tax=Sulfitobacter sp. D35 TaxID=3083252 RepID=UPI00296E368E|nr:DUF2147 domain-containing protein [Sulfitobacter sp. D35]MDW4497429.1 DUF2147 domain-containing protein [Sulfitobacter sp. D35]
MRTILIATVATLSATAALAADPIYGTWQTAKDDNGNFGHIEVAPCGAKICGTLVRSYNPDGTQLQSPHVGRQIIWDMQAQGGGAYAGGKVWSPDRDKTYNSKLALSGDQLKVSGCVIGICRDGGTWVRVK